MSFSGPPNLDGAGDDLAFRTLAHDVDKVGSAGRPGSDLSRRAGDK